ncbi:MAG TPA: DUF3857 domain-containing protein [Terriglobales bacterium]
MQANLRMAAALAAVACFGAFSFGTAFTTAQTGAPAVNAAATPPPAPLATPAQRLAQAVQTFTAAGREPEINLRQVQQLVALYRVAEATELVPPAAALQALDQLSSAVRGGNPAEALIAAEIDDQRARDELRAGDGEAAARIWRQLGEVESWQAVGPFDNSSPAAIEKEEGPEHGVELHAHYAGKQRQVGWRRMPFAAPQGVLNLGAYLNPSESASAYVVSWVRSPAAQEVAIRLRDNGATRVWVNGGLVFDEQAAHPSSGFDEDAAGARLEAGWNEILAKTGGTESTDWRFSLRLTTPAGAPLVLDATAMPPADIVARVQAATAPAASAISDLTALAQAAASSSPSYELDYAWVLNQKHNFNTGGQDDANAFMAAIAGLPNDAQAVLDFAAHDSDQSRRYRYLDQLLTRDPGNAQAHRMLGSIELTRNEFWPAREQFRAAMGLTTSPDANGLAPPSAADIARAPLAAVGLLGTYLGTGISPEVLAWAAALRQAHVTSALVAGPVGAALRRVGAIHPALEWFATAHADDAADLAVSLQLADVQRQSGDLAAALATIRQATALAGSPPALLETEARAYSGLGRGPEALATIEQAVAAAPDSPDLRVAAGEIESHFGHPTLAIAAWQAALNLNPQDADLRDRLRIGRGGEAAQEASFERPYTQDVTQAIAAFKKAANPGLESGPVTVLANTNVTNIFPSGNIGRYVQEIFRINNSNGADSLAYYPVTYDPATEDVQFLTARVIHPDGTSADAPKAGDQPVSQSVGYETFYDVRNKFVQMPPMRAGDFVEIAYRVLPTTLESLYGDYYGDLDSFGGPAPTQFQQYVVITPSNKPLYFKAIRFDGTSEQHTAQGQTVYRWSDHNLPAQVPEPSAPPEIERSPYIEVSSFQTWNQFGDWYRQLIRDTFVMDSEMVQTVNSLIQGKTTEQEKVDAIYRWVIQNTHYVALEFGIHGYRPYPVTQVFHRRFGDCKDKASLLIALLHQAGIPADFVLVRIRDLGVIDATIPSVADFDHAIVYVPSLHRYLDGTAEYNGADELPAGDQRAFVLRLPVLANPAAAETPSAALGQMGGPSAEAAPAFRAQATQASGAQAGLAPVVTPDQPPADNVMTRVLNGQLEANGDLHFEMTWTLEGEHAPVFRQALELPDRQAGAVQAMLHTRLPGINITGATVTNESDWDDPIEVKLVGVIPRFATVNGTTLLIPRQIVPQQWLPEMASLAQRSEDLLTGPPQILSEEMHLALPPGYQVAALPAPTQQNEPFASFAAAAAMNGGTLTLRSRVVTKQSLITPAEYGRFRSFWSQVDATLGRPLASVPTAGAPANGGGQ